MSTISGSNGPSERRPEAAPSVPAAGLLYVTVSLMCFTAVVSVLGSYWFVVRVLGPPSPERARSARAADRDGQPSDVAVAERLDELEQRLDGLSSQLDDLSQRLAPDRASAATARADDPATDPPAVVTDPSEIATE